MISTGEKTHELRRRPPSQEAIGKIALIYATAPLSAVFCACRVEDIVSEEREALWKGIGQHTGCTKLEYDDYFSRCDFANAVRLTVLDVPLYRATRAELKLRFQFYPPQSWRWADDLEELIG
ncbi:hypothetical protein IFT84_20250 [Rhizobium sp. CFBP 8762]|nr:hypothetical protein [Rhizobium sp. CFBP 8762]